MPPILLYCRQLPDWQGEKKYKSKNWGVRKYLIKSQFGTYALRSHFKLIFLIEINNRILCSQWKWAKTLLDWGALLHTIQDGRNWVLPSCMQWSFLHHWTWKAGLFLCQLGFNNVCWLQADLSIWVLIMGDQPFQKGWYEFLNMCIMSLFPICAI